MIKEYSVSDMRKMAVAVQKVCAEEATKTIYGLDGDLISSAILAIKVDELITKAKKKLESPLRSD